ncbi:MAG: (2Fe-2S)-binding protein [Nitrospirae bacterium]|nr:(2Fe-2S)-binding protein [Nitrospirota bacterium]
MANLVTMKIDGKEVQLPEGMNLIDAAESVGIHIPNLCHLKGMKGIGACRMCLVEIEGMKAPVTACTMKVKQDMKIKTDTERVKEIRKFVIDLILSMHPLDCMTCPKAGVCWLQQYAYDFDIRESTFTRKSFGYKIDNENPFIERDPNYCILCGRCVRVCKEQGTRILEFMGRGVTAKVTTAQDKPLHETDCTFCGNCIDACPVNAILEAGRRLHGREWEFTKTETTCTLCGSNCSLVVSVKEDNVIKIASPKPNGYICAAGRFGYDSLKSPKRISKPMIRIEGQLVETTWQDALKIIIEKLKAVKKNPSSAGFIASAGITNEDAYALQKFARAAIGTNNIDSTASLYDKATVDAYLNSFGKIPEAAHCITEADVIVA